MKSGIKTSEMWLTVIQAVAGLLISVGASRGLLVEEKIDVPAVQEEIGEIYESNDLREIVQGVLSIGGLIASGLAVNGYAKRRTELKMAAESVETDTD